MQRVDTHKGCSQRFIVVIPLFIVKYSREKSTTFSVGKNAKNRYRGMRTHLRRIREIILVATDAIKAPRSSYQLLKTMQTRPDSPLPHVATVVTETDAPSRFASLFNRAKKRRNAYLSTEKSVTAFRKTDLQYARQDLNLQFSVPKTVQL